MLRVTGALLGVSSVSRTLSRKLAIFCHPIYRVSIFGTFMRIWLFFYNIARKFLVQRRRSLMKDMYFHVHTHILYCHKQIRKKEKRFGSIRKYVIFKLK